MQVIKKALAWVFVAPCIVFVLVVVCFNFLSFFLLAGFAKAMEFFACYGGIDVYEIPVLKKIDNIYYALAKEVGI